MSRSLLHCPVCGESFSPDQPSCAHVQFVYSFDRAKFSHLSESLAQQITLADVAQADCPDDCWQSLPELAQAILMQRPQTAVIEWQSRQQSWTGWLIGIDWQPEAMSLAQEQLGWQLSQVTQWQLPTSEA